jgi:hypothetical protein
MAAAVGIAWAWEGAWPARAGLAALGITLGLTLRVLANAAQNLYEGRRDGLWLLTRLTREMGRLRAEVAAQRPPEEAPADASIRLEDDHG